ncbi:ATP-dependent Clp protease proteolytic subunit-related protein 1 [Hibiscus syriacus]|uniref:ATP-dependent Clp protease proteolytic subunit n=1 Tax=Hibiscus syriacus TaxID=106335 RepID=A0A6A3ADS4_HIBSY|nr:ATP-dependent Clp protease proteolytic subunit-related protein 1 [Hibiscus syriacus]
MAASQFLSLTAPNPEAMGPVIGACKSSFITGTKLFLSKKPRSRRPIAQKCFKHPFSKSIDHIPKQFREQNLKDGFRRQSESVTEESISSARNYLNNGGSGRPRTAPPDLPSLLLDARICYLGMPDEKMETVGSETEAYAIADTMAYCKSEFYTVNCGMAFGQAAMLLSQGAKGYRAVQPNSSTKLYLPKVSRSSGAVIDMWIKARELDANTESYIELLAKGTGKTKEEIEKDIQRPKYFQAQEAIDYGLADKIIDSRDAAFEKRNYDEMLAQSKAMRRAAGGPQAAPSGFR